MDAVTLALMQYSASSGGGTTDETVTGNAPITLSDASAKQIVSLTQTGLCTQASTPTPSSPVDIKCNNGTLKMVDDELPSAYKRVLGFTCDNNAMWQISGFKLKGSDTVRISFSVLAACNVFGCYQGTEATDNYDLYASITSGSKYFRYGNGTYLSYFSTGNLGRRFDVVFTPTGSTGMPEDSTWSAATFESANDLLIGSTTTTGTSSKLKGNLYGDFIVDGRLHLIPCERVSDNVLGYYDTVGETFYEPYTGFDGAVSLGYDGSHYELQTVGTPEVLTVTDSDSNTQTASVVNLLSVGFYADTQEIISGAVTRKCGVFVPDGSENWSSISDTRYQLNFPAAVADSVCRSSHFVYSNSTSGAGKIRIAISGHIQVVVESTTLDDFKDWLKGQYAYGTPVIVIYALATPTAQHTTEQPLTTAEGTNTVDVTAEASPIALTAVYKRGSGNGSSSAWLLQCLLRTSQRTIRP